MRRAMFLFTALILFCAIATVRTHASPASQEARRAPEKVRPAHRVMWMCIHRQERTQWHDGNAPYWGGLQMGAWFVSTYATPTVRKRLHLYGYPDQWTPLQQMRVAEHAYKLSGYSRSWLWNQWPPSRGVCF